MAFDSESELEEGTPVVKKLRKVPALAQRQCKKEDGEEEDKQETEEKVELEKEEPIQPKNGKKTGMVARKQVRDNSDVDKISHFDKQYLTSLSLKNARGT
ncbi:hypothetical protein AKJ16_DCAP26602 [Drosera capensis]